MNLALLPSGARIRRSEWHRRAHRTQVRSGRGRRRRGVDGHYQIVVSSSLLPPPNHQSLPTRPPPTHLPITNLPVKRYFLPDGGVFDEGWCRPQNDGPGLRAISLMIYADSLGGPASDEVNSLLWTGDDANQNGGRWVVEEIK